MREAPVRFNFTAVVWHLKIGQCHCRHFMNVLFFGLIKNNYFVNLINLLLFYTHWKAVATKWHLCSDWPWGGFPHTQRRSYWLFMILVKQLWLGEKQLTSCGLKVPGATFPKCSASYAKEQGAVPQPLLHKNTSRTKFTNDSFWNFLQIVRHVYMSCAKYF